MTTTSTNLLASLFTTPPTLPTPKLAILLSGTAGDGAALARLFDRIHHPDHYYAIHLDARANDTERRRLAQHVAHYPGNNVLLLDPPLLVTYMGISMLEVTLRGMSALLSLSSLSSSSWDYFINLSASDYPLVSVETMVQVLSMAPSKSNFICSKHLDRPGEEWFATDRLFRVVIDPALHTQYRGERTSIDTLALNAPSRGIPTAYTMFKGEAWVVLARDFVEYVLFGADGFARRVLLYLTNVKSAPEQYFATVACNSASFNRTVFNDHLRFIDWQPRKQHPSELTMDMVPYLQQDHYNAGGLFARKVMRDDVKDAMDDVAQSGNMDRAARLRMEEALRAFGGCDWEPSRPLRGKG